MLKTIVVYDSWTGNTEKIAKVIALQCNAKIVHVNEAEHSLQAYELAIIGTPDIKGRPCGKMVQFLQQANLPQRCAIFITYGAPLWGPISAYKCVSFFKSLLNEKKVQFAGCFVCPGFHAKFKTYKNRPNASDLSGARDFASRLGSIKTS